MAAGIARIQVAAAFVAALIVVVGGAASKALRPPSEVTDARRAEIRADLDARPLTAKLGGETSRPLAGQRAFTFPAANLDLADERAFFFGNRLFNTNWAEAPASVKAFDGLGPFFNRAACASCHVRDGRGRAPDGPGLPFDSMLLRLSVPGREADGAPKPHPIYGDQLSDRAIAGLKPEGQPSVEWTEMPGRYPDGTAYSLRRPTYSIGDLGYGPLGPDISVSPRVAPQVIGLGLLEAVPDETLLALADPDDADGDGISGRPNLIGNRTTGTIRLGRFGWKANQIDIRTQSAAAAIGDIGLTTSLFRRENRPRAKLAARIISGGTPELSDVFLDKLLLYMRTLAVPMQRDAGAPEVTRGKDVFRAIGCGACHRPTLVTGPHPVAAVANQVIHPFTDLLLHDMGEGLADHRPDFEATGSEWRTPPLWGIGLFGVTNGHTTYLHDGRARSIEEAILWHDGEAEAVRQRFMAAPAGDRAALLAFLGSL